MLLAHLPWRKNGWINWELTFQSWINTNTEFWGSDSNWTKQRTQYLLTDAHFSQPFYRCYQVKGGKSLYYEERKKPKRMFIGPPQFPTYCKASNQASKGMEIIGTVISYSQFIYPPLCCSTLLLICHCSDSCGQLHCGASILHPNNPHHFCNHP